MSHWTDTRTSTARPAARQLPSFPWILLPHNLALVLGRTLLVVRDVAVAVVGIVRRHVRLAIAAVLVVVGLYGLTVMLGSDGVPRGTTVMGVSIGGMSRERAQETLQSAWDGRVSGALAVDALGQSTTLPMRAVDFDAQATVADLATNRWWPWDLAKSILGGGPAAPVMAIDQTAVDGVIDKLAGSSPDAAKEPMIRFDGTTPVVEDGRAGLEIDRTRAAQAMTAAVVAGAPSVALPSSYAEPRVDRYEVRRVLEKVARPAVSGPVRVTLPDGSVEVTPEDLAAVLTFRADGRTLAADVDGVALARRVQDRVPGATAVQPAAYDVVNGNPQVIPSTPGKGLNPVALDAAVTDIVSRPDAARQATLALTATVPDVIPAELQAQGVNTQVSTFTQHFDAAEYRRINIGEAARRLNGTVVPAGGVFSMNDTVGERTEANGYTQGIVVGEGGVLTRDMGGGVSAATTTVWTAAFLAGMEKVEQSAHSIYISRYTPGLEATVSWGNLDLKFRNNTGAPLYITSKADDTSINVSMFGERRFDRVEARLGEKRNFTSPGATSGSGAQCVSSSGIQGFDITVQRVMFRAGQEVGSEPFTTHYEPSPAVSCG